MEDGTRVTTVSYEASPREFVRQDMMRMVNVIIG